MGNNISDAISNGVGGLLTAGALGLIGYLCSKKKASAGENGEWVALEPNRNHWFNEQK